MINNFRARPVRLAALSAAALLSVSACGGSGDPLKSGSAGTPTNTSTPAHVSVAAPPTSSTKHTDDGAVAFVRYYFETLLNDAYQTGSVEGIARVSDPNCVICRATIGDIAYFAAAGMRPQGGKVSVSSVKVASSSPDLDTVTLSYSVEKLSELNRDGSTAFSTPAVSSQQIVAQVQWDVTASAWRMRQIVNKPLSSITATPTSSP